MVDGSGYKNDRQDGLDFTLHHYTKTIFAKEKAFNRRFPLDKYLIPFVGNKKEVSIADIGSGMWSTTGSILPGVKVNIYPSDELAEEYMSVLKSYSVKPVFPIEKQNMEALTYEDESFDIVHCVNALDHCLDPKKAIQEMYRVCKKGGYIYLRHFFNTALTQKERGLHKWNIIFTINGDCVFWGPLGSFLLSHVYSDFKNEAKKELGYEKYRMAVSVLHKQ